MKNYEKIEETMEQLRELLLESGAKVELHASFKWKGTTLDYVWRM